MKKLSTSIVFYSLFCITAFGEDIVSDATYSNITNRSAWNNGENYSTTPLLSVQSGGSLSVESSSFENNSLIFENSPASGVGAQGLIKVSGGSLSVKNSSFEGNSSATTPADGAAYPNTQGSAIYAPSALNVEVSGTKFAGNKSSAKSVQGGALAIFGGSYTLSNNVLTAINQTLPCIRATDGLMARRDIFLTAGRIHR